VPAITSRITSAIRNIPINTSAGSYFPTAAREVDDGLFHHRQSRRSATAWIKAICRVVPVMVAIIIVISDGYL